MPQTGRVSRGLENPGHFLTIIQCTMGVPETQLKAFLALKGRDSFYEMGIVCCVRNSQFVSVNDTVYSPRQSVLSF